MVLSLSMGRMCHLFLVTTCSLCTVSEVWHVSLISQSDPLCSLTGSLGSPVSLFITLNWQKSFGHCLAWAVLAHLCPLLAVRLQSGYISVLRLSFLICKMGLLIVRSELLMELDEGKVG